MKGHAHLLARTLARWAKGGQPAADGLTGDAGLAHLMACAAETHCRPPRGAAALLPAPTTLGWVCVWGALAGCHHPTHAPLRARIQHTAPPRPASLSPNPKPPLPTLAVPGHASHAPLALNLPPPRPATRPALNPKAPTPKAINPEPRPPQAGSTTRVLRNSASPELSVPRAEDYASLLAQQRITLASAQRADAIWEAVVGAAQEVGGRRRAWRASTALCDWSLSGLGPACPPPLQQFAHSLPSCQLPSVLGRFSTHMRVQTHARTLTWTPPPPSPDLGPRRRRSAAACRPRRAATCLPRWCSWWRAPPWCGAALNRASSSCPGAGSGWVCVCAAGRGVAGGLTAVGWCIQSTHRWNHLLFARLDCLLCSTTN